jgi:hypothetical protein
MRAAGQIEEIELQFATPIISELCFAVNDFDLATMVAASSVAKELKSTTIIETVEHTLNYATFLINIMCETRGYDEPGWMLRMAEWSQERT